MKKMIPSSMNNLPLLSTMQNYTHLLPNCGTIIFAVEGISIIFGILASHEESKTGKYPYILLRLFPRSEYTNPYHRLHSCDPCADC